MADYYINSDRGKGLANSMRAGDMAEASDGSLWRKEADGSISVIKNGQTMTGRVGVSPSVPSVSNTQTISAPSPLETPALDAARRSSPSYSLQQKAAAQVRQNLASEKAKQATQNVTSGLTQENTGEDLLAQATEAGSYTIGSAKGVLMTDKMQNAGDMAEASDGSLWKRNADGSISVTKNGKTYTANVDRAAAKQDPQWAVLTAPPAEESEDTGTKKSKKKSSGTSSGSGSSSSLNTYFSGVSTGTKKETTQAASSSTGGDIASLRKKAASAQKDMADIARQIAAKKAQASAQGKTPNTSALEAKYAEAKDRYDKASAQVTAAKAPKNEGPTLLEAATSAPEKRAAVQKEAWRSLPTVADADRFSINKAADAQTREAEQQFFAFARRELQQNAWRSLPTVQDSERFSIPSQTDSLMQQAIAQAPRTLSGKPYLPENDGGFSHSSGTSKSVKDRLAAQQMNIAMANDDYDTIRRIREQNNYLDDNESFKYMAGRAKTGLLGAIQGVGNALSYLFQAKEPEGYDWDNPVMTGDQFAESVSGLKQTFSFADTDAQKFAQRYAGRNIPAAQQTAGSVAEGVAGMIPTIAANIAVPGSSLYVLFTQAAGSATTDALQRGASGQNAVAYGVANGALEVLTEKMFDGVAGVFGKGAADDALQSLVRRVTQNEGAQNALLEIADSLGEGFEEFVSEFGDKVLADLLLKDDDRNFRLVLADAGESFLVGALTSAVMQAAGSITKNTTPKKAAEKVNDILQEDIRQEGINANVREAAQQSALDRGMLETMRPQAFQTPAWAELLDTQQTTQGAAERGTDGVATGGEATQRPLTQDKLLDYAIQAASRGEILTSPPQRMSESSGQNVRTMNQMGTNNAYASAEENAAARSYTHERVSNAEQFARANGRVLTDSDGNVSNYAGQVQELLASERWSNTDRDVAATLRHEAFQRDDMDSFYRLSDRITETNTEAGRTLQGTQKWLEQAHPEQSVVAAAKKALDTNPKAPSGKMAFIEKTAREISGFGDNVSQWAGALKQIAEERRMTGVDMLVRMAEKQGANDPQWLKSLVYNGLYNVAGDYEKPTGAVDTVNKGLRRLKSYVITNQLFRVTTNAANVVSNSISNVTEAAAANTGTAHLADVIMSQFTGLRSHGTFENVLGREALTTGKNLAQKSFVEIWLDTSTEATDSKFQSSRGRAVREYKMAGNQLFSTIDAVLSTALNTTDAFATGVSQGAAQAALRRNIQKGYLTAEQALDVAEQRGSDTTFHNKTVLGTTLQRVQAAMNGGLEYGAGNIVAGNYLNVPAAVLMREVSKMPTVGTVGALIDMAAVCIDGKTGKNTIGDLQAKITGEKLTLAQRQSRAAQQLGRSLALGTMEVAGYTALALKGIIRRIDDDDKDKAAFEAAGGQQGLYINWSALWRSVPGGDSEWQDGDVITNLGRLEPLTVNMNFGIDVAEALKTDEGLRTEDLKNISISAVQDGIADLSMIQNIQGIMNALQYRSEDQSAFQAVGQELLASNVASLTPGLIQQAAKAIDPYYRDLYTGDTSGQQIYDIWANTIPGLRQQLPEKLTGFGTPKEYAGTDTERAANAFLNPYATTTMRSKTGLETMLQDAEDVSVYPSRNPIGSVSVDGQTVELTNGQKRQYQTVYGQTYRDTLYALQGSSAFQQLDRQTKDAVMKAAESYAGVSAKNALDIGYKPPEDYAERAEMDSTALADALILEAVKSQKYLSPETRAAKSAVENQYSSADYARQSLDLVESAKEKAAAYFEHAEQAKYGGELTEAEQELAGKDSEYIADYFMRKAIDGYKNADGMTGHLSGENAVKYSAVAKSFDTPLFSAVTDDLLAQAKKKAHAFYTEVEKTDFGGVMSADNRALNRKFAKMDNDEIAQYFLSVAAKEKYKDTNGNGTNLDEAAEALKSGDITDPTVFAFLDSDIVEDYRRYGKGGSITPEILLHAARAKKTVKQDTDQDGVVVNTSQEQFEDWVNRQSWTQTQKQDVMKVFYPNTAEKKNYLVESLNSGKMKYTDAKKELTPTLQAGWTHQLLPTLAENANDTTKGVLMSQYIEAAAAYDDRPNASERKALNYSYAWQWFCDYLNTTDMTREQKYQVALIMSGTDSQKTKDKIWSRLR